MQALAQSVQTAQHSIGCQLCEIGNKIQWKCLDCSLLMCSRCKDKVHLKIKGAIDHELIDIKDVGKHKSEGHIKKSDLKCDEHVGQICCLLCKTCVQLICMKCLLKLHKGHDVIEEEEFETELEELLKNQADTAAQLSKVSLNAEVHENRLEKTEEKDQQIAVEIKVVRHFSTDLNKIRNVVSGPDDTLWINDGDNKIVQYVKLTKDTIHVISQYNIKVYDMATISSTDILIAVPVPRLRLLSERNGHVPYSKFNVEPLFPCALHVTDDQKVIIGAKPPGNPFVTKTGSRVVVVFDKEGRPSTEYELDNCNKPLFTYPFRITSTKNGNIFVADGLDTSKRGRVVVFGQEGKIQIYTGRSDEGRLFRPVDLLTTQLDNVVVACFSLHTLYILNPEGQLLTIYRTDMIGIKVPHSIAISRPGHFYIGCTTPHNSPDTLKANLYEVQFSGF